jgi:hypothetical protein
MTPRPALSKLDELQALFGETQAPIAADALHDLVERSADWLDKIYHLSPADIVDAAAVLNE